MSVTSGTRGPRAEDSDRAEGVRGRAEGDRSRSEGDRSRPEGAPSRRPRSDGQRSRRAILQGATELATLQGLEGLSIGRLAGHIGMSKSGLYAHFGSKEELQLATIDAAEEIFAREVVEPTMEQPEGRARVLAFCDAYLSYLERGVFPGGCFFAATAGEAGVPEGPVKDRLREYMAGGVDALADMIRAAQTLEEVDPDADAAQLAFEIDALLHGANASFVLHGKSDPLERARRGIRERLGAA
jgi:AcrR family transcriptional regulator